jgi:hypothetical protein
MWKQTPDYKTGDTIPIGDLKIAYPFDILFSAEGARH